MTPKEIEAERELFEAAYRRLFPVSCEVQPNVFERDQGTYASPTIYAAFQTWLAARASIRPAQAAEPVAHMWQHPETGMTGFVEHAPPDELAHWERMNRPRRIIAPLYTAPQAAEERKPLSDERIETVLDAADEWERYVDEDHAPMTLRKYLSRALCIKED